MNIKDIETGAARENTSGAAAYGNNQPDNTGSNNPQQDSRSPGHSGVPAAHPDEAMRGNRMPTRSPRRDVIRVKNSNP